MTDTHLPIQAACLVFLLISSAFFSSAETVFTTVNRIKIQLLAEEGNHQAARVLKILDNSPAMLSAILIGNNIVNISASALTTTVTIQLLGNGYVGIATGILTFLVLIFGEIFPKTLASVHSLRLSLSYAGLVWMLMKLLTPVIVIVEWLRTTAMKAAHIDPDATDTSMTEDELKELVDVSMEDGAIEADEFEMIAGVFSLDDTLARDIMIPRIDMTYVQADMSHEELMEIYEENKYTRYPVYDDNRDTVIGTINVKDLLLRDTANFRVRDILRTPFFTFEHKEIGTLLLEMKKQSISIAIVLDEYGCTVGMITMEDLLEEIVGEIRDEYDKDETDPIRELVPGKEYLVNGSTNLDDVNEAMDLKLVSGEYDSIGGYLIEHLDRLPKKGEAVDLEEGLRIIAEVVHRNRIEKVHIIKK